MDSPIALRSVKTFLPADYKTIEPGKTDFYDTLKASALLSSKENKLITPYSAKEAHHIYTEKKTVARNLVNDGDLGYKDIKDLDYFLYIGIWETTITGLRFRKKDLNNSYEIGDKITVEVIETDISKYICQIADPKFARENFKDIIADMNKVVGVARVPYARGETVREMNEYGIFEEIIIWKPQRFPNRRFSTHAYLSNLSIPLDSISSQYDTIVSIQIGSYDYPGSRTIDAQSSRSYAELNQCFRCLIRGSFHE